MTDGASERAFSVRGLSKAFGVTQALRDVSFGVARGNIHALLGGNGSGKSTLIKILAGVQHADAGEIEVGGATLDATAITPAQSLEAGFRFVHQHDSVFPELSVTENLHLGRGFDVNRAGGIKWAAAHERARTVLERFGLDVDPRTPIGRLGKARQTMVAIARALQDQEGERSGVLVLDEPTAALPTAEVALLVDALRRYAAEGQSILFVSHRLDEVCDLVGAATILRDGVCTGTVGGESLEPERLVALMLGEEREAVETRSRRRRVARRERIALTAEGISCGALADASVCVREGEILGIAGLLGSGRSTLLRALFGLQQIDAGRLVDSDGRRLAFRSPVEAMRAGMAYVPEDRTRDAAFQDLSVSENLSMAVTSQYWKGGRLRLGAERADAAALAARFSIKAASPGARFASLSGGNQQKVILARWLRRSPHVLLLDEPTQGVDVCARSEIHSLVEEAVEGGAAAVVVSSEFDELETIADRALVLRRGQVAEELSGADVTADRLEQLVHNGRGS